MQAIIWLKKPVPVAGDEVKILIADVLNVDFPRVLVKVGENHTLEAYADTVIEGDEVDSIICLISNGSGGYIAGVSDIRVIDPATL